MFKLLENPFFSGNDGPLNFSHPSIYACKKTPFHNIKINLLISRLQNVYVLENQFFKASLNFFH